MKGQNSLTNMDGLNHLIFSLPCIDQIFEIKLLQNNSTSRPTHITLRKKPQKKTTTKNKQL